MISYCSPYDPDVACTNRRRDESGRSHLLLIVAEDNDLGGSPALDDDLLIGISLELAGALGGVAGSRSTATKLRRDNGVVGNLLRDILGLESCILVGHGLGDGRAALVWDLGGLGLGRTLLLGAWCCSCISIVPCSAFQSILTSKVGISLVANRVLLIDLELELLSFADELVLKSLGLLSLIRGRLAAGLVLEEARVHLHLVLDLVGGALLGHGLVADFELELLLFLKSQTLVPDVFDWHDDCLIRLLID